MGVEAKVVLRQPEALLESWLSEIEARWHEIPKFKVDTERLGHLAIICDGNRRAASKRGLHLYFGHRAGVEVFPNLAPQSLLKPIQKFLGYERRFGR